MQAYCRRVFAIIVFVLDFSFIVLFFVVVVKYELSRNANSANNGQLGQGDEETILLENGAINYVHRDTAGKTRGMNRWKHIWIFVSRCRSIAKSAR